MSAAGKIAPAYADRPQADRRPFYPIWSPTPDREIHVVLVSQSLLGVFTHWIDGRTRPCLGSREECVGCDLKLPRRWKCFLGAFNPASGRLGILEVTQEAFLRCRQLNEDSGKLRGLTVRLIRTGLAKNARVTALVGARVTAGATVPPSFDVKAALERVWFSATPEGLDAAEPAATDLLGEEV